MSLQIRHLRCSTESSWVEATNHWLLNKKQKYKAKSVYLPAGETPKPIYKNWQLYHHDFLDGLNFIQIDDVATGPKKDIFKKFFQEQLPDFQKQMTFFESGDLVADLAILGLGMNGHVAFHEPGISKDFFSGCLELNSKTLEVLSLEKGTKGQTYGLSAFLKARAILMVVKGEKKRAIVDRLLSCDPSVPASFLAQHIDFTLITDF